MRDETYYESAQGEVIDRRRALLELHRHGVRDDESIQEFFDDMGDYGHYSAAAVLAWLGY